MGGAGAGAEATKKALRATASAGDNGTSVTPVEQQQKKKEHPALLLAAGVTGSGGADGSAPAVHHQSCSGEDQADDEQVERFYALLANIRALRGLYSAGDSDAGAGPAASSGRAGSRKRAREAEAPWTPAFRLEDFDHEVNQGASAADDARYAVKLKNQDATSGGVARRPAAAAARARAAVADDGHQEDEVARGGGNKLGRRRVAARG